MKAALFLLALAHFTAADTLDRIAITVGNQAITETQIDRDIEMAALINGTAPDFSTGSRLKAASRLVEQAFVRREMNFGAYPTVPEKQVEEALASTEKTIGSENMAKRLADYGLTRKDLEEYLRWQLDLLKFIDLRFRPGVQVTESDIESYFKQTFAAKGGKTPDLAALHDQIEQKLTDERADQQVDQWLRQTRRRVPVRYLDPSLQPPPDDKPSATLAN